MPIDIAALNTLTASLNIPDEDVDLSAEETTSRTRTRLAGEQANEARSADALISTRVHRETRLLPAHRRNAVGQREERLSLGEQSRVLPDAPGAPLPDFTAEWRQIREDLENQAAGALRIGQNLIKIRDALKPLGAWLATMRANGMSQPQASRYIRYAQLPERDRAIYQRVRGFSLSEAIGERRRKRKAPGEAGEVSGGGRAADYSRANSRRRAAEGGREGIPADELDDRRAEIDRRFTVAIKMIDAGKAALADGPKPPEYAGDPARWLSELRETADDMRAVINEGLEAALKKRLLPDLE